MKKIFILICIIFSINSFGQAGLDTIYVRNLTLRAEDWYWLKGAWYPSDAVGKAAWKKMRNKLTSDNPATNATNVTIDSIPGRIALTFYSMFLNASKGETGNLTNNISTNIKAYTPMVIHTNVVDADFQTRFQGRRGDGKDDFNN